jgi:katanin p60 ATPase-containing subunit A1
MSLISIRATTDANSAEQKRIQERRKNLMILVHQYLIENGYIESAERFQAETNSMTSKFTVADNVDLMSILIDFESYYEIRFDKKPKIIRKVNEGEEPKLLKSANRTSDSGKSKPRKDSGTEGTKLPPIVAPETDNSKSTDFSVTGTTMAASTKGTTANNNEKPELEERILKPPPNFFGDSELKQLANVISREIYQESPNVRFSDIVHLDEAKRLLMEAVQLPIRFPTLFTGILRPWRGILLHGPPGTGKTLLAKAVATECHTTFFNISASTLISKWRGDSEKLVRVLFELARYHAPSTIFLDEIDSILTSRNGGDGGGGEHEASRRMKTELLIQLDGLNHSTDSNGKPALVFVMAASNLPWELDIALLRRLEKRVLVSLPTPEAREMMFRKHLSDRCGPAAEMDFREVARQTEGYSGADIELVCRESAMMPVRRLIQKIDTLGDGGNNMMPPPEQQQQQQTRMIPEPPISSSSGRGNNPSKKAGAPAVVVPLKNLNSAAQNDIDILLKNDPVTMEDIRTALQSTKPSSDGKITK